MATLTFNINELRKNTEKGKLLSEEKFLELEKTARQRLKNIVNENFNTLLQSTLHDINQQASEGKNYYFFMILASSWDKENWENRRYTKDYLVDEVELKVTKKIPFGVLENDTEVSNYDRFDFDRVIAWMCAKKIALYFLRNELAVSYGKREVIITTEHQSQQRYKTNHFKIPCLKICW